MATQLGGGGTPVSAAQAESQQPQSGAERLLKMLHRNIGTLSKNVEQSMERLEILHAAPFGAGQHAMGGPRQATAQGPAQQAGMGTPPQTRQRAESAPARVAADFVSPNGVAEHLSGRGA